MRLYAVFALAAFFCLSARAGEDVVLFRKESPREERGKGVIQRECAIQTPACKLEYVAHFAPGESRPLTGKWGDLRLGLYFGSFYGNGSWDRWNFLDVKVDDAGKAVDPRQLFPLDDVYLLESESRVLADFVWPLSEKPDFAAADNLTVTLAHGIGDKDWLFFRIGVSSADKTLSSVGVSAFPASTVGPKNRERWIAYDGGRGTTHQGKVGIPAAAGGAMLFNQFAQTQDGCLLVFLPEEVESASAAGTYGVKVTLSAKKGLKALRLALGYFHGESWEKVEPRFLTEMRPNILARLRDYDWQARLDLEEAARLMEETGALCLPRSFWPGIVADGDKAVAVPQRAETAAEFERLRGLFETARADGNARNALHVADQIGRIRQQALQLALNQLK